ncbi:MAG: AmmeMemoRadiSam system radical SAM enzyme [Planctomycetia bacterium]|nr:AmmeMemoRadiSam system radical SAM enzyme [Planctomycetia bacterium]
MTLRYQTVLNAEQSQCLLCPRQCVLSRGQRGFCHVRQNQNGTICSATYGYTTGLAVDPIEKKPLYHFLPGSQVLSFGTLGCNMGCQFCQNWSISKSTAGTDVLTQIAPDAIAQVAAQYGCASVAFTYNEPTVFFEYALDTAKACHALGLKTVAVSAGYINPGPRREFYRHMDAVNLDLKGFSDAFYQKFCQARLDHVLDTIKYVAQDTSVWLELTTLLIEGENDSDDELARECDWIVENAGPYVPVHFSAFHPAWKLQNHARTSLATLLHARDIAIRAGLKHVYAGNVSHIASSTTCCESCGQTLIVRNGFTVKQNEAPNGICPHCGQQLAGVFSAAR